MSYLALPRGGINERHAIICPIECVPSRVHLSDAARIEMMRFQNCIDAMMVQSSCASLRFERALRTKGGRDHMQLQIVPVRFSQLADCVVTSSKPLQMFMQKAGAAELKFHEIQVRKLFRLLHSNCDCLASLIFLRE